MSLFTTSGFASAAASGTDWRDTAKAVLEQLESVRTEGHRCNFGFLYISDHLAEDAQSILNLFKSVLGVQNWVGGIGLGVCASGQDFIDVPAISAMIGVFEEDEFCLIPPIGEEPSPALEEWLKTNEPMLTFVHGDPMAEQDPAIGARVLEEACGGFVVGGLTSSRRHHAQFAGELYEGALCGAVFSSRVKVATTLSQGCTPVGEIHTITRADGHTVLEIDGKPALGIFEDDIRTMAIRVTGIDPNLVMVDEEAAEDKAAIPDEFQTMLKGEVHAALPVQGSDGHDFLVRNIIGLDPDKGALTIAQDFSPGDRIMFVHRDNESVYRDLSASLIALRKRVQHDTGAFKPRGAVYISCVARAFGRPEGQNGQEMRLIRDIIGDVPLAGFYAGGEICKARLYGYTGILTLFL
jgi:small ligand-binding sensory domain FIST